MVGHPLRVIAGFNPAIHAMTEQHVSPLKVITSQRHGMDGRLGGRP
jgi:hypothetical protein